MLSSYRSVSSPPRRSCSPSTSAPPIPTLAALVGQRHRTLSRLIGVLVVPDGSDPVREGEADLTRARNTSQNGGTCPILSLGAGGGGAGMIRPLLVPGQATMPWGSITYFLA